MLQRFIVSAILFSFPFNVEAAKIKVRLVDEKNQGVAEGDAKLVNTQSKEEQLKKANKKGELTFDKVNAGSYDILAQKSGYLPAKSSGVQVASADIEVNVKLVTEGQFRQIESLANAALQQKKMDKTLSSYKQLLEYAPENAVIWSNLARVYGMQNNWEKAIEAAQKAASLDPSLAAFAKQMESFAGYTKGQEYLDQQKFPQAVEVLSKAVQDDPTNSDAFYALALSYGHQKKYIEAIKNAEEAAKLRPDDTDYQKLVQILKHNAEVENKK